MVVKAICVCAEDEDSKVQEEPGMGLEIDTVARCLGQTTEWKVRKEGSEQGCQHLGAAPSPLLSTLSSFQLASKCCCCFLLQ